MEGSLHEFGYLLENRAVVPLSLHDEEQGPMLLQEGSFRAVAEMEPGGLDPLSSLGKTLLWATHSSPASPRLGFVGQGSTFSPPVL